MSTDELDEIVGQICDVDDRYDPEVYYFLREVLAYLYEKLNLGADAAPRHMTGEEVASGFRDYALLEFGPLAHLVLTQWGLQSTMDIGEVVFNLVEAGVLGKQPSDKKQDFADLYEFDKTFAKPFEPKFNFLRT